MTRQELEQLCEPQTPEQVLEGLRNLYNYLSNSFAPEEDDLTAMNASIAVLEKEIEDTSFSPSVRIIRSIY